MKKHTRIYARDIINLRMPKPSYIDLSTIEGRQKFYQTPEWRALRYLRLQIDPYCVDCLKFKKYEVASEVDHIIPIKARPDLAFVFDNTQSLCKSCHGKKTFKENINKGFIGKNFKGKNKMTVVNKKWSFFPDEDRYI